VTTERDFLEAIAAAPDDDGPRLVFADWFEEHDDPDRAEFIRLQIALAEKDEYDSDFNMLMDREQDLQRTHGHRWKIPELKGRQEFRRGFVEFVWLRGDRLALEAERVNRVPTVQALRISGADHHLDDLAKLPYLDRIRSLDLSNNSVPARNRLLQFFEQSNLSSLSALRLRNNMLWPEQLQAMAHHPSFPRLRLLDVSGNPLGDEGIAIVAEAECFRELRTLVCRSNRLDISHAIHESGAVRLANSPVLRRLSHLDLEGHTIGDGGILSFAHSNRLNDLEWLDLSDNDIGLADDHWATPFIQARTLERVRVLRLRHNRIGRKARKILERWQLRRTGRIIDFGHDESQESPS
jgi:uncharacterized protein (TIGR02996 family)